MNFQSRLIGNIWLHTLADQKYQGTYMRVTLLHSFSSAEDKVYRLLPEYLVQLYPHWLKLVKEQSTFVTVHQLFYALQGGRFSFSQHDHASFQITQFDVQLPGENHGSDHRQCCQNALDHLFDLFIVPWNLQDRAFERLEKQVIRTALGSSVKEVPYTFACYQHWLEQTQVHVHVIDQTAKLRIEQTLRKKSFLFSNGKQRPRRLTDPRQARSSLAGRETVIVRPTDSGVKKLFVMLNCTQGITDVFPAIFVLNELLQSRLGKEIRERRQLAYDVHCELLLFEALLRIRCSVAEGDTDRVLHIIRSEWDQIRKGKVSETDLENAKREVLHFFLYGYDLPFKMMDAHFNEWLVDFHTSAEDISHLLKETTVVDVVQVAERIEWREDDRLVTERGDNG